MSECYKSYIHWQIYVMKLKPLNARSDTALFTWSQLTHLFDGAEQHSRFEFRTVTAAKTLPDVFSELQVRPTHDCNTWLYQHYQCWCFCFSLSLSPSLPLSLSLSLSPSLPLCFPSFLSLPWLPCLKKSCLSSRLIMLFRGEDMSNQDGKFRRLVLVCSLRYHYKIM